jgi:hypothetical protein
MVIWPRSCVEGFNPVWLLHRVPIYGRVPLADHQTTSATKAIGSSSHQSYHDEKRQARAHREKMSTMDTPTRRWALLLPALAILTACLSACQQLDQRAFQGSSRSAPSLTMSTPNAGSAVATPTGARFTLGAWPSNSMPGPNERIMIYVICRVQDPTMSGPSTPAAGIKVQVRVNDSINRSYGGTTNNGGMARVPIAFHEARLGLPIIVDVAATWQHVTYQSQTSFTPAPGVRRPHPSGTSTPHHEETPTPTPASGRPPEPTVTPSAGPTPTPQPTPMATNTPTTTPPPIPTDSPASP